MIRARGRALLLLALAALACAGLAFALVRVAETRAAVTGRPHLLLLTGLPLMFGEEFSLKGTDSATLQRLRERYEIVPISTSSARELAKGRLLLMAQPFAQAPENLVALDEWVRRGGRVLLLADPMLEWPSKHPLGDPLRPPPTFTDTGLLDHWGLRLDGPDQRGPMLRRLAGREIQTVSPGALFGQCKLSADRLVADCRIGKGRAVVVADADFLDLSDMDGPTDNNLPALLGELERLAVGEGERVAQSQTYPQG